MAKKKKTRFLYVLDCDKTWGFDQSEHAQGPIKYYNVQCNLNQAFLTPPC